MFFIKDTSDKQDLSNNPIEKALGNKSPPDITIKEGN